jgi:hypothetical protein
MEEFLFFILGLVMGGITALVSVASMIIITKRTEKKKSKD